MMDFILIPSVVAIVFCGTYKLFELFVRRKERLTVIDKFDPNQVPNILTGQIAFDGNGGRGFGAMKFGCLFIGVGLGLLVGFLISSTVYPAGVNTYIMSDSWQVREMVGMLYGASVFVFGGIGLVTAFVIERKLKK